MFKAAEVRASPKSRDDGDSVVKGIYCEWGKWHMVYDPQDVCTCQDKYQVPPHEMVRIRKELYPNWTYGNPMYCTGNALTKTMLAKILATYRARHAEEI